MASLAAISTSFLPSSVVPSSSSSSSSSGSKRRHSFRIRAQASPINPSIRKDEPKVVDTVLISEVDKPVNAYCRCWKSKTFPLCDGTHVKHNKETGDNVGPLLLKK